MKKLHLLPLFAILLGLVSCRNDLETADWDVDLLAPILISELDMGDIVGDTNIAVNPDSSLILVYSTPLVEYGLGDLMDPFSYTHYEFLSLDSLELDDIVIPSSISLGQIANSAGFVGAIIIANNGNNMVVPDLGSVPGTSAPIDASEYFESIELIDGTLEISIENELPIDVEDFGFGIQNNISTDYLIQDTLDIIPAGTTVTSTNSLAGKTIDSDLLAEIYGLSSPGSNGQSVLIDTSDALRITLTIRDLRPLSATTIWPAQNIINDTSEVFLSGSEGLELTYGEIKTGEIQMSIESTIKDSVEFEYLIPESELNGSPFGFVEAVPAAPPNGVATLVKDYDFTGLSMDLTGKKNNRYNTFYHIILGRIDSTGLIVELSLEDSLVVELAMNDLVIDYALGDLGQDSADIGPEYSELQGMNSLVSGIVNLDQALGSLELYNPIGASAQFQLDEIIGENRRTNNQVVLDLSQTGSSLQVGPATESGGSINAAQNSLDLTESNSNINEFVANLPDRIKFSGRVIMNPDGPYSGFIYYDHPFEARLNLEVPLGLSAENLTLVDTSDFDLGTAPEWDQIRGGEIRLLVANGFPCEAVTTMTLLDINGDVLENILLNDVVQSPDLDANLKVIEPKSSTLTIPLSPERIQRFKEATNVRYEIVFNTAQLPSSVKIYSTYKMDIKMIGDFTYRLNN